MAEKIVHEGIVTEVSENSVTVRIQAASACGSCHAKNLCQMSEKTDKDVTVKTKDARLYRKGERVDVFLMSGMGLKAVLYAYVLSLVAAAAGFLIAALITPNEVIRGLACLAAIALYFLFLKFKSDKINARFSFGIEKRQEAGNIQID
ncbi:MAG: SoxR reducing system RseC family protein [Bacteroides sp.]|nr:SoxR reducing system RseC family protein [Ruminococcus flavefaciens]MCM1553935.1 SoxR reducing system RseC family protein [Bacteroides sp.]